MEHFVDSAIALTAFAGVILGMMAVVGIVTVLGAIALAFGACILAGIGHLALSALRKVSAIAEALASAYAPSTPAGGQARRRAR